MGLAPYGEPRYAGVILGATDRPQGRRVLPAELDYFNYCVGLTMTNRKFDALFGQPPRTPEQLLTQFHMDIAASIQQVTEEILLRMTRAAGKGDRRAQPVPGGRRRAELRRQRQGAARPQFREHLDPAGGRRCRRRGRGCALRLSPVPQAAASPAPALDGMRGSYLGPEFGQSDIENRLLAVGAKFSVHDEAGVIAQDCRCAGRAESRRLVPGANGIRTSRAGARSIIGDPRSPTMQKTLNLKVKYRESFRPFAPAVLREDVSDWFELDYDSPYMLLVADVRAARRRVMTDEEKKLFGIEKLNVPRSEIPAVTHIDYSARVQTVHRETNPRFHALLAAFKQKTGCPVLVNTSFNVRGEPIVCTPEDAFRCFMGPRSRRW
jgi:carbamoyltransferase